MKKWVGGGHGLVEKSGQGSPRCFLMGWTMSPVARASHGNVNLDGQMMGKNWERVRFCFIAAPDVAKTNLGRTRGGKKQGVPQFIAVERITPRAAWRATISETVTPRAARRATIFEPVTPRRGFQARYGFRQDYYAVKSHYVPTIVSRLALPDPQSRLLHRDLGVFKIITQ